MLHHRSSLASRVCGAGSYLRSRAPSLNLVRTTVVQPLTVPFLRRMVLHSSSLYTSQHLGRHSSRHGSRRVAGAPWRRECPQQSWCREYSRQSEASMSIGWVRHLWPFPPFSSIYRWLPVCRAELGRSSGGSGAELDFFRHRCSHWLRFHGLLVSQCVRARSGEFSLHIPRTCASARIQDDPIMLQVVDCIVSACRPLQLRVSRDAFGFRPDVRA